MVSHIYVIPGGLPHNTPHLRIPNFFSLRLFHISLNSSWHLPGLESSSRQASLTGQNSMAWLGHAPETTPSLPQTDCIHIGKWGICPVESYLGRQWRKASYLNQSDEACKAFHWPELSHN